MVTTAEIQPGSVLIVTVTKVEAQAVLEVFSTEQKWNRRIIGGKTYYDLGVHGGCLVYMVQSEMGTATPGGSLLTVRRAIDDLHPQAVIMCGIAFGLRPDKQHLGDILVSRQIQYYEPQKVDVQRGEMPRGDRTTASERLLDRFRSGDNDWQGAPTHFGLVLSGEKLVNDPAFRDWLLATEPEAVGGEMEGVGLYAAAREAKVDWILVKAICDWADGEKHDGAQPLAAHNAAQFVRHVILIGGWVGSTQPDKGEMKKSGEVGGESRTSIKAGDIHVSAGGIVNIAGRDIIASEPSKESVKIKDDEKQGPQEIREEDGFLLMLNQGKIDHPALAAAIQDSPEKSAKALLAFMQQIPAPENPADLQPLIIKLCCHPTFQDVRLKEALQQAYESLPGVHPRPVDVASWPVKPARWRGLQGINAGNIHTKLFLSSDAVEAAETSLLFGGAHPLFWPGHDLYQRLSNNSEERLIWGDRGVGRTAFAKALSLYLDKKDVLGCYLADSPHVEKVAHGFADQVLAFICRNPEWITLSQPERELLAQSLMSCLDRNLTVAQLDRALQKAVAAGRAENKRVGESETARRAKAKRSNETWALSLLKYEVERLQEKPSFEMGVWLESMLLCTRQMGFTRWRLACDIPAGTRQVQVLEAVLALLPVWRQVGARMDMPMDLLVFSSKSPPEDLLSSEIGLSSREELHWRPFKDKMPLRAMVEWRLEQLCAGAIHKTLTEICSEESFASLLQRSRHNPRRFGVLWNEEVAVLPPDRLPA